MKTLKNILIKSHFGGLALALLNFIPVLKNKDKIHEKYSVLRFAYQKYIRGKSFTANNGYRYVNKGVYDYQFFNTCFLNDMIANTVFVQSKGYYPIINLYNSDGGYNIWEMFFVQPFAGKKGIVKDTDIDKTYNESVCYISPFFFSYKNKAERKIWFELYKRYVVFNEKTQQYLDEEYQSLIADKRVLGVLCRGTDYTTTKPKNHPRQPELEDVIKDVKQLLIDEHYEYIYLATEEKRIHEVFEREFPGLIIINKRTYYDEIYYSQKAGALLNSVKFERKDDDYLKGLEYLSSLNLLSRCQGLIGGNCGGTLAAYYMNHGKYEYVKIYDLGVY